MEILLSLIFYSYFSSNCLYFIFKHKAQVVHVKKSVQLVFFEETYLELM